MRSVTGRTCTKARVAEGWDSDLGCIRSYIRRFSAYGSEIGRLQVTAEYGSNPTTDEQIAELRRYHDQFTWSFHPSESYINSDRPRIRRMVSRLVELGCTPFPV